ncbi:MAG: aminoacyl-tRNA hydrolase [Oscillospiraceae bacterium]|nr:aminoacyl-tRNA hydrolase [Oscillospiraceae bacterium]
MFFTSRAKGPRWLVACLGNPGEQYRETRHNVGFLTADLLGQQWDTPVKRAKFSALTGIALVGDEKVMILKPQTYMNRSGDAVYMAMRSFQIPTERIIVVTDDTALEPGRLRIRRRGSPGGHNGLKSIGIRLRSEDFPRVKIGVGGPPHPDYDLADWVLSRPAGKDREAVQGAIANAAAAVEIIIRGGIDAAMQRFN